MNSKMVFHVITMNFSCSILPKCFHKLLIQYCYTLSCFPFQHYTTQHFNYKDHLLWL